MTIKIPFYEKLYQLGKYRFWISKKFIVALTTSLISLISWSQTWMKCNKLEPVYKKKRPLPQSLKMNLLQIRQPRNEKSWIHCFVKDKMENVSKRLIYFSQQFYIHLFAIYFEFNFEIEEYHYSVSIETDWTVGKCFSFLFCWDAFFLSWIKSGPIWFSQI